MKKILKWFGVVIVIVLLIPVLVAFVMGFHDGPLEILSGGPFKSGELTQRPASWDFLSDRDQIEFQTLEPLRSRTVWLGVFEGRLFLVSGYMTTSYGRIWKQWPHYLDNDNRIILRIDGKLYEQRMQRIMDGPEVLAVLGEFNRKYGDSLDAGEAEVTEGHTWMFEVLDR